MLKFSFEDVVFVLVITNDVLVIAVILVIVVISGVVFVVTASLMSQISKINKIQKPFFFMKQINNLLGTPKAFSPELYVLDTGLNRLKETT